MKAKRLVALLLALVMIVGLFAMTASAYTYRDSCGVCYDLYGSSLKNMRVEFGTPTTIGSTRVEGCGRRSGSHIHYTKKYLVREICTQHGLINDYYVTEYDVCSG